MQQFALAEFRGTTVPFVANRARLPDALWVKPGFYPDDSPANYRRFSEQFAYLIRGNECFTALEFGPEQRLLEGERYGGEGIGDNGGGVRCGNLDGVQIKGVGCNPLVGRAGDRWHSYGGLNALDALYETILAEALGQILPCGVVPVFGIILTAHDAAYYTPQERGWGALLVREISLRPGHFLRSPVYRPKTPSAPRISPDAVRVREANRGLNRIFPEKRDLVRWLGQFLLNCANQFAFARVARITHGNVTPSNLSFDGRWLDLTNAGFIVGGSNVGGCPAFYEEPGAIARYLTEFVDTFGKYNDLDLTVRPLVDYYFQQLEAHGRYWASTLFGIDPEQVRDIRETTDYCLLAHHASLVLGIGKTLINTWPHAVVEDDPVICLQYGLFLSLRDPARAVDHLERIRRRDPDFQTMDCIDAFARVLAESHRMAQGKLGDFRAFVTLCAIQALKRSLSVEFFFKGRLTRTIRAVMDTDPHRGRALIADSRLIASWIFQRDDTDTATLFAGEGWSLEFEAQSGRFRLQERDGDFAAFPTAQGALTALDGTPDAAFAIHGYNFKPNVQKLLRTLIDIEPTCPK